MDTDSQRMVYDSAADFLSLFANKNRLLILGLISESEIRVGELALLAGISQSALSQHLALLRSGRLVTTRREAQTIYYSCSSAAVKTMLETVDSLFAPSSAILIDNYERRGGKRLSARRNS